MKKLRWRLTMLILCIVICSSLLGLCAPLLARSGVIQRPDTEKFLLFGLAFRDFIVLILTLSGAILLILLISRRTATPIMELEKAMKEVASGNYDVKVKINRKTEEYTSLQQSFNTMALELKSNEYLRKSFMANVSHELKTPISIINGYAKLLSEPDLDEESRMEYASYIAKESSRLATMTGNMLKISRLDTQGIAAKFEKFSLDEQLRRAVLLLEPRWSAKEIELSVSLEPAEYAGDEELLSHVWYNLLDNAVKFTPQGGKISLSSSRSDGYIRVAVSDSGIGMDGDTASKAFMQFYRGANSGSDQGSGLGLPLAKRICELHRGTITLDSAPGKGSTFTVLLPVAEAPKATSSSRPSSH